MLKFIGTRLLFLIPVVLGVIIIAFTLSYFMPGDPVINHLGKNYTQEEYDEVQHEMGLDQPYVVQLGKYIWGVVTRFDLGTSYDTGRDVTAAIGDRVWVTIKLGLLSCGFIALIGIPFGIICAVKQYSLADNVVTVLSIFLASMPNFWLAMVAMILFSLHLGWLPASGLTTWKHYILPVVCNGLSVVAVVTRMTRSSMLEVIRQDYIRTARAKGLKEGVIIRKHALSNALIPIITVMGFEVSSVIGGSVVIESIFSIAGIGSLMVEAINSRDYPSIVGITVIISIFVCILNLIVDLVYAVADPRIKGQFAGEKKRKSRDKKKEVAT